MDFTIWWREKYLKHHPFFFNYGLGSNFRHNPRMWANSVGTLDLFFWKAPHHHRYHTLLLVLSHVLFLKVPQIAEGFYDAARGDGHYPSYTTVIMLNNNVAPSVFRSVLPTLFWSYHDNNPFQVGKPQTLGKVKYLCGCLNPGQFIHCIFIPTFLARLVCHSVPESSA